MLTLKYGAKEVPIKTWKFPAGEVGVKIEGYFVSTFNTDREENVLITLHWEGNDDLLALMQLVDAVKQRGGVKEINLSVPYFPYARQDRRCFEGEGHALKMVASLINSLGFARVYTQDAHSYVLEAVVDKLVNIPQHICATNLPAFDILVAPDNGASKKVYHFSAKHGDVVVADKKRDSAGRIVKSALPEGVDLSGRVCVVDDICDGGATFMELGQVVRASHKPKELSLYVTHGLFTKGVDDLLKMYDNIYVHNLINKSVKHFVKEI